MHSIKNLRRRTLAWTTGGLATLAMAGAAAVTTGTTSASASTAAVTRPASAAAPASRSGPFPFQLVPSSSDIRSCLPHARGEALIIPGKQNDLMRVAVHGMPANSEFDLFVIQTPGKPFGVSWYQTDIDVDRHGNGSAVVQGIFDAETFSVAIPGSNPTFGATHQFHLGLWFNDPQLPFDLGCEPGLAKAAVTPFNGEQNAGIQVLNTSEFPDNAGPLSHVHR
jgi:hypothetical protein